ncbi:hypothetical protein [Sinomonas albida]|uniref:hypothetical protein n=1 Tax=Sinomonas albida TaxID=369942 RepID=UPI0030176C42
MVLPGFTGIALETSACDEHLRRLEAGEDWILGDPDDPYDIRMGVDIPPKIISFSITERASRNDLAELRMALQSAKGPADITVSLDGEMQRSLLRVLGGGGSAV